MRRRGRRIAWALVGSGLVVVMVAAIVIFQRLAARQRIQDLLSAGESVDEEGQGKPGWPASPIEAEVIAADSEKGMVVLGAGPEQKVETGFVFIIYRDGDDIAFVQVVKVVDDLCAAKVHCVTTGIRIRRGDRASTVGQ